MKKLLVCVLASWATLCARGALAELNVAEGSIESPDGLFVGRDFSIVNDFKLELLYVTDTATEGQWVAMGWDNQGRLMVPSYNSDKMARLTIPQVGQPGEVQVEMIDTTKVAAAEGILYAFDSLYMNANRSNTMRHGLYRIFDTDGDDQWDTTRVLRNFQGDGSDHGTHTLQLSPDGRSIYVINGNATRPTEWHRSRVPEIWGEDNLIRRLIRGAPGFNRAPDAHILSFNSDASDIELFSMGMRNPVSFAFNKDGEIFVYDADHEPDWGIAEYRPTSIVHAISGGDTGWRASSRVHPFWQFDYFAPIAIVGAGSPTGSAFGTGAKFPARYQDSFFALDYSYGNVWAVRLTPDGASYQADVLPFVSGRPFAVSGAIVNPADGSLLVQTTATQLYRITYVGDEDTTPTQPDTRYEGMRSLRHRLEQFHGRQDPAAITAAWPYLGDADRAIRYAARTAIEWQDVSLWRERALSEREPRAAIAAIAALARVSAPDEFHEVPGSNPVRDKQLQARMIAALDRIDLADLSFQDKLDLIRAYDLTMIRLGRPDQATINRIVARFDPYFPGKQREMNWELAELMIYLEAPSAAEKVMGLIREAPSTPYYGIQEWPNPQQRQRGEPGMLGPQGKSQAELARQEDQIHYTELLRVLRTGWTPELRREYLEWFITAPPTFSGRGLGTINTVRTDAIAMIPEAERAQYQDLIEAETGVTGGGGFGGGGGNGTPGIGAPMTSLYIPRGGVRAFTDLDMTALTQFDESHEAQLAEQTAAREALAAASFSAPYDAARIQSAVDRMADAELDLALIMATQAPAIKSELQVASPERLDVFIQAVNTRGGRGNFVAGGGGGGGGRGAAPAAAPAGRGNN